MTIRTTVTAVTFTHAFKLPNMDEAYPPGTYDIETDEEALDTMEHVGYRRTATRIRLRNGGTTQVLQIDRRDLDIALTDDKD
jgi:hypothetical protein